MNPIRVADNNDLFVMCYRNRHGQYEVYSVDKETGYRYREQFNTWWDALDYYDSLGCDENDSLADTEYQCLETMFQFMKVSNPIAFGFNFNQQGEC